MSLRKAVNAQKRSLALKKHEVEKKTKSTRPKKKTWLWVLGWICIFPVPLTILLLRNKRMDKRLRIGLIVLAWVTYIAIASSGGGKEMANTQTKDESSIETPTQSTTGEDIGSATEASPAGESSEAVETSDEIPMGTETEPRIITADDVPTVRDGEYVTITGHGDIRQSLTGTINIGDPSYGNQNDHRKYGISVTLEGTNSTYFIDADVLNFDKYKNVFASNAPVAFNDMTVTISGYVAEINYSDEDDSLLGFNFGDCVLEDMSY